MSEKKNGGAGVGDGKQEFSLISNETLLDLYRGLLKARVLRASDNTWDFDAAAVAVAKDLRVDDAVIADGATNVLRLMPAPGRAKAGMKTEFADELEWAVGAALSYKTKKNGKVTVVFGGGAHGEVWTDVLEIARAHRLPMIFVAELREEIPARRNARKPNGAELEPGAEMARIIVDGHDVVASYRVAHEAIERARKDRGPTLMECAAFRIAGRRRQDSIAAMEQYLREKGLIERGRRQEMLEAIAREMRIRV
jgi:TPP-dependent pyruvate/acetoin dehydrogenase alpha subunit